MFLLNLFRLKRFFRFHFFSLRAVEEILRILRKDCRACITVWSMEQKMNDTISEYLKMRAKKKNVQMNRREGNGRLRVHEGSDFTQQDMLVPWQDAGGNHHLRSLFILCFAIFD